jgi:hypothetical protein
MQQEFMFQDGSKGRLGRRHCQTVREPAGCVRVTALQTWADQSTHRFAFVGNAGRALSFIEPLATTWREGNELMGLCDPSAARRQYCGGILVGELG